jgi:disulfide oxidoreductase YuzD
MSQYLKTETRYQVIEYNSVLRDWIIASSSTQDRAEVDNWLSILKSKYPNGQFKIAKVELIVSVLDEGE